MRHQVTISSLVRWRPSTIFCRVFGGTLSLKNARTSSRNATSSLLKARSIGSSCEANIIFLSSVRTQGPITTGVRDFESRLPRVPKARPRRMGPGSRPGRRLESMHHLEQTGRTHAAAHAHRHDHELRLAATAFDQ